MGNPTGLADFFNVLLHSPARMDRPRSDPPASKQRTRVVIIGGGFGGLTAAQSLRGSGLEVVLIDRTNHHLFQPLLYQVATAALSPSDIAWPLRTIFRSRTNVQVVMDEVQTIDRVGRQVVLAEGGAIPFDALIVSPGSRHSYFGHNEWEAHAPGLKTLTDALTLRERLLLSFEKAEQLKGAAEAQRYLTFVIVGGGPTGVELAGALAEIGRKAMTPDYPSLRSASLKILLLEGTERILSAYPLVLSAKAQWALQAMGVTVMLNTKVVDVTPRGVSTGREFIETANVIWAAGNTASSLIQSLKTPVDSAGRAIVRSDLTIPDDPWIFVIGDAACCLGADGKPLPGLAPVAMQEGRYVARVIAKGIPPDRREPFRYVDRGMMTTIGRAKAIAQLGPVKLSGLPAWLIWCVVHIFFLIGVRNRFRVMSEWIWYYLTFRPGARLIYWKREKSD